MISYAQAPEDARRVFEPSSKLRELREAEEALHDMQTQLSAALKQKERLAQLGGAVARISHDLRNILTTAQLFADRVEMSEDPGRAAHRAEADRLDQPGGEPHRGDAVLRPRRRARAAARPDRRWPRWSRTWSKASAWPPASTTSPTARMCRGALTVRADPEQLYRILRNLVRNARQAIEASGAAGEIWSRREEARRNGRSPSPTPARACRPRRRRRCSNPSPPAGARAAPALASPSPPISRAATAAGSSWSAPARTAPPSPSTCRAGIDGAAA